MKNSGFIKQEDKKYIILLVIFTFLIFIHLLDNPFIADDAGWLKIGRDLNYFSLFRTGWSGLFTPLVNWFFYLSYRLFGLSSVGYYLFNIMFHILNVVLVYYFVKILTEIIYSKPNKIVSFLSAAIFSSTCVHYQAVVWISCMKYLLLTFLYMGSLISYLTFITKKTIIYYFLSLFLFILALLTHEIGFTLVVLLLLTDMLCFPQMGSIREKLKFIIPFIFIGSIYILFYYFKIYPFSFYKTHGIVREFFSFKFIFFFLF